MSQPQTASASSSLGRLPRDTGSAQDTVTPLCPEGDGMLCWKVWFCWFLFGCFFFNWEAGVLCFESILFLLCVFHDWLFQVCFGIF